MEIAVIAPMLVCARPARMDTTLITLVRANIVMLVTALNATLMVLASHVTKAITRTPLVFANTVNMGTAVINATLRASVRVVKLAITRTPMAATSAL